MLRFDMGIALKGAVVRWWRLAVLAGAGALGALAATVLAVAVNVATGGTARWFPTMDQYPLIWSAGATAAVACAGLLAWGAQRWYDRTLAELVPAVQQLEPWVVGRPGELNQVVRALRRRGRTVGITTAVQGAGGFGKTTVAKMVRADRRVMRMFAGRVYWVTLGRDAGREALAGLVNGLIAQLDPGHPQTFVDVGQASDYLAALLASGPRRLLVLDDVWSPEHLEAFPVAGRCTRLVTTRVPSLAEGAAAAVRVDQMTGPQARALLLAGLPSLPPDLVSGLLRETRRWPLLLRLVNKILVNQGKLQPDISAAAQDLLEQLQAGGALRVDQLAGSAEQSLDVADPGQRSRTVRATIQAGASLLSPGEHARLAELAVFAEDETIPVTLITRFWKAADGLDELTAGSLISRLADLALIALVPVTGGTAVTMHDVIRDYLREETAGPQLAQLHGALVDAGAADLPAASAGGPEGGTVTAWWQLPEQARYLREHLIEHLLAAGRPREAEETAADLRWAGMRLQASGPAAPSADLALVATPRTERLARLLGQAAHLLAPTDPPHSLTDILYSRAASDPDWGPQARALAPGRRLPALANQWLPPDLTRPALRRVLPGHTGAISVMAVAPDGTWLAAADRSGRVLTWDTATGQPRAVIHAGPIETSLGNFDAVSALAILADGARLVTAHADTEAGRWVQIQVWDAATGERTGSKGVAGPSLPSLALSPDGAHLACSSKTGGLLVWDTATGELRAIVEHGAYPVMDVAVSLGGTLVAGRDSLGALAWEPATGSVHRIRPADRSEPSTWPGSRVVSRSTIRSRIRFMEGYSHWRAMVAVVPDGSLVVFADERGRVHTWDAASRATRSVEVWDTPTPYVSVYPRAVAPDGTWLATAEADGLVQIWDTATGRQRTALTGHAAQVTAAAVAPDGTWLATGDAAGLVRTWDTSPSAGSPAAHGEELEVTAVTFAPDGTWLATGDEAGGVRIWDAVTGQRRPLLTERRFPLVAEPWRTPLTGATRISVRESLGRIHKVAVAPDGTWLAATYSNGHLLIWDTTTEKARAVLDNRLDKVTAVAIAPDGTWLAAASSNGRVHILDAATQERRAVLDNRLDKVTAVAIAPDGTWLAATSGNGHVLIWDTATQEHISTFISVAAVTPTAVAIASDGTWLATVHQFSVRIWDTRTGSIRTTLASRGAQVTAATIAPDSARLATASADGALHVWDPHSGNPIATMRADSPLEDCAWSPSGHLLAAAGKSGIYLYAFNWA